MNSFSTQNTLLPRYKTNWFELFKEIFFVYLKNGTKQKVLVSNIQISLNKNPGAKYSNNHASNCSRLIK
jgi:hypothetical protein